MSLGNNMRDWLAELAMFSVLNGLDFIFLSSDATYMRCADVEGHDGPHYCHIEWGEGSA